MTKASSKGLGIAYSDCGKGKMRCVLRLRLITFANADEKSPTLFPIFFPESSIWKKKLSVTLNIFAEFVNWAVSVQSRIAIEGTSQHVLLNFGGQEGQGIYFGYGKTSLADVHFFFFCEYLNFRHQVEQKSHENYVDSLVTGLLIWFVPYSKWCTLVKGDSLSTLSRNLHVFNI